MLSSLLNLMLFLAARYVVKDVKPTPKGDTQKVKVKVRVNLNGMFTVSGAQLTEKRDATEQEQAEAEQKESEAKQQELQNKDGNAQQEPMDTTETSDTTSELNHKDEPMEEDGDKKDKKKTKQITKVVELPVEISMGGYTSQELNLHIEEEVCFTPNLCFS